MLHVSMVSYFGEAGLVAVFFTGSFIIGADTGPAGSFICLFNACRIPGYMSLLILRILNNTMALPKMPPLKCLIETVLSFLFSFFHFFVFGGSDFFLPPIASPLMQIVASGYF